MPPPDPVVEDEADERPDTEIETCGWWYPGQTAKEDGEIDLAPDVRGALSPAYRPDKDGQHGAKGECPDEWSVQSISAEEALWSDDAPQHGAIEVDPRDGACETIDSFGGADARDGFEGPVEDGDLGQRRDDGGDELDLEEDAGRYRHVEA